MKNFKYHFALIISNLMFGANYSFYSSLIGGHDISSEGLYVLRTIVSVLFFSGIMFISGKWRIDVKDLYKLGIVAALLVFGRQYLMLDAMNYTSPIDGSIIATTGPIFIMIISAFILKERFTMTRTLGIILGFGGALLLILSNMHGGSVSGKMLGNILLLVSIILSAVDTVFIKGLFKKYEPLTIMGWAYLIAIVVVAPVFGGDLIKTDFSKWTLWTYGSMGYVLLIGTVLAMFLSFYGLGGVSATASSMYTYVQPIMGTALAVMRGQDKLTWILLLSTALIFAGVFFVIRSYKSKTTQVHHIPS